MRTFTLDTGRTALTLALTDDGRFLRQSLAGPGFSPAGESEEFFFTLNGTLLSGNTPGWELVDEAACQGSQGESIRSFTLAREGVRVTREYTLYMGQSAIGMRTVIHNVTDAAVTVADPSILVIRGAEAAATYGYMTGAANFTGSLMYKEVALDRDFVRTFDSHGDPEMVEVEGVFKNDMHPVPNGAGIWCELYTFAGDAGRLWTAFDYQGWWMGQVSRVDGRVGLKVWCNLTWEVAPGEDMPIAAAVVGSAAGDVDDMGNDITSYIYAYKWDYTRDRYFLASYNNIWREAPLAGKVWHLIREAQAIGTPQIWVDDFWFDAKGNWNGIFGDDWGHINRYLKQLGMDFRIWMPPWQADRLSQVWLEHPEWMLGFHGNWYNWTIDMSQEEAYRWILDMLTRKQEEFGSYMLRVDGNPTCLRNNGSFNATGGDYNASYKQSENFYRLYKEFKDKNPDAGLNGCSSGGHTMTIEAVRYTDHQQITDGLCLHNGGYWSPLFNPIDKVAPLTASRLSQNPDTQPMSEEAIREHRERALFCRWARKVGLAGRGVLVYRPEVLHGDKTFFLQRLSADRMRGMITVLGRKFPSAGKPETVYPKGLLPDTLYTVEDPAGSMAAETRTGAQWMQDGISVPAAEARMRLYLNLTDRPGSGACTDVPAAPVALSAARETWMGHDGIMLRWQADGDDALIAYYALCRNGEKIAEVAAGHGWLDTEGKAGDAYTVCAVSGDGIASAQVTFPAL